MVYAHISHGLLDSPAGDGPVAVGRPSRVGPDVGRGARPARPPGPTFGCRTPRARGGPPRTSAPTTHPAPTRPGARRTRAALGAGCPNGLGTRRTRAALGAGLSGGGGGPRAGTVSWWTKKPLSPDAEEMEQGRRGRVEEFYDGIEKGRRNKELEVFQHEGKQDGHDVPPLGVCPSFDNGVWRKRLE